MFQDCSSLQSVTMPSTLRAIGAGMFAGCSNLTTLDLPYQNIEYVGQYGLRSCGMSGRYEFPILKRIRMGSFTRTVNAEELSFPSVYELEKDNNNGDISMFSGCTNLKKLTLGALTTIDGGRGYGSVDRRFCASCPALKVVDFGSAVTTIGLNLAFRDGTNSLSAVIIRTTTPPTTTYTQFSDFCNTNRPYIYVPDTAVNDYKQSSYWSWASDYIKPLSEYVESDYITWSTDVVHGRVQTTEP